MKRFVVMCMAFGFAAVLISPAWAGVSGDNNGSGNGIVISNDIYNNAGGGGSPQYEYLVDRLPTNNCTPEELEFGGCVEGSFTDCALGKPAGPQYDWARAEIEQRLIDAGLGKTS